MPSDNPNDDQLDRDLDALELRIQQQQAELDSWRQEDERKEQEALLKNAARPQIQSILKSLGLNENAIVQITRSLGGIARFVRRDEHGRLLMSLGGAELPLAEGLHDHPCVQAMLQSADDRVFVSPVVRAQRRISEIDAEIVEAKAAYGRDRQSPHLTRVSVLQRERKTLTDEVSSATSQAPRSAAIVDPRLLLEKRRLQAEVDAAKLEFNRSGGKSRRAMDRFTLANRELKSVLAKINAS